MVLAMSMVAADREAMADAGEFQQRPAHGAITQR